MSIHANSYIDGAGGLFFGNNISIAHNCSVLTAEHDWTNRSLPIKYNEVKLKETKLADDIWIGCGSRILGGTSIGNRVVIGANSVVKGEVFNDSIYVGVPARRIKEI
ncbi:hypothetical protein AB4383_16115 [Vibrio breoganii]